MKNFIIIISKGRILNEVKYFLYKNCLLLKDLKSRKLFNKIKNINIYFFIIKNIDIIKYFKKKISDIYFTGKDMFYEKLKNKFYKYYNLKISKSKLSLICKNINKIKSKKIYTKYKNISKNYLKYKNLKFKIIFFESSIENLLNLNISEFIIDIISSYKTLKLNNLYELENILNLNLILIINRFILNLKIFKFLRFLWRF